MTPRVLIIDDSMFIRALIRRQFERIGCTVVAEAENAAQGLNLFRSVKPDVITLDIVMAEADGVDSLGAFRAIRKEAPEAAVILMTAVPFEESRLTFMRDGALEYVVKPFNGAVFEQLRHKLSARFPEIARDSHSASAAEPRDSR